MTLEELKRLIADGEGERLECKETTGQRGEACRTLCAFLNGDGGTVVFGVSRGGKLTGQLVSDETKRDLARAFCDFVPGIEILTEYVPVDETHQAVVCRVAGGPHKPYAYDGRPYRRVQSTTTKMPQDQYAALIARRGGFQSKWELQWDENVSMDDVDLAEVTRTAKIAVAEGRLAPDVNINDPKDLLRRFGLLKDEHPLNGAMALFGKNLTFYPQCILKMAWFKGKDKTIFLDNRMVEGNIIQLQSEAMAFCFKHLNLSGVVRGLYREEELEVPAEALREAIINALAHRLYTSGGSVSLAIYEDRVEISNPGNFSPDASAQGIGAGMASTPRNPTIAKVLYLRKAIEMWGRGIGLILAACERAHLAAPKIYEDRGFVYTVFARPTAQEWQGKVGETDEVNRDVNHEVNVGTNGTKDGTKKSDEGANGVNDGDKEVLGAVNCGTNVGTKDEESGTNDANDDVNGTCVGTKNDLNGTKEVGVGTNCKENGTNEFDDDELLLENVRNEPNLSLEELAERLNVSRRTVARMVEHLKAQGRIRRVGGTRGHWET